MFVHCEAIVGHLLSCSGQRNCKRLEFMYVIMSGQRVQVPPPPLPLQLYMFEGGIVYACV